MIKAEIVGHSLSPQGDELISVLCTFPRIILAEVNTHRMLSKNTSSSRAIPFNKMVEAVQENPFIPIAWQKEHKGMQGSEYFTEEKEIKAKTNAWLTARDNAIQSAKFLNSNLVVHEIGGEDFISYNQFDEDSLEGLRAKERLENTKVTKQLCNRLLEPFMWTTMLITGSKEGWDNFFNLRCPQYQDINTVRADGKGTYYKSKKEYEISANVSEYEDFVDFDWKEINKGQAEIHMMALAEAIYDAMNESTPKQLQAGEWHIPFKNRIDDGKAAEAQSPNVALSQIGLTLNGVRVKISTAMAARTSYTVVGDEKEVDYSKMIELHDRLITEDPPHFSPLEHCARAMSDEEYYLFNKGKASLSSWDKSPYELHYTNSERGWCGPYKGFMSYRYFIDNNLEI